MSSRVAIPHHPSSPNRVPLQLPRRPRGRHQNPRRGLPPGPRQGAQGLPPLRSCHTSHRRRHAPPPRPHRPPEPLARLDLRGLRHFYRHLHLPPYPLHRHHRARRPVTSAPGIVTGVRDSPCDPSAKLVHQAMGHNPRRLDSKILFYKRFMNLFHDRFMEHKLSNSLEVC